MRGNGSLIGALAAAMLLLTAVGALAENLPPVEPTTDGGQTSTPPPTETYPEEERALK